MILTKQLCYRAIVLSLFFQSYIGAMIPNTVVGTINTGVNPTGIAITPNNNFAYVANTNSLGISGGNSVSVLNLRNNTVEGVITDPSFNQPFSVTINPQGTIGYVTNSNGSTISTIDLATNTVTGTINGFSGPSGLVINPTNNTGYVINYGVGANSGKIGTVNLVDLNTNTIVGSPITVGNAPAAIALSPNGQQLYTVNYVNGNPGEGTLSVINTATNMVTNTISGFSGPFNLVVTPNGRFAYVTNFGSNNFNPIGSTVSVVDLNSKAIVDTIDLGIQPSGIAITPNGRYVYVTNYNTLYAGPNFSNLTAGQGTVNVIDTTTNQVVSSTIPVGESPGNIAIARNGNFAYVTNFTANTVDVIALQNFTITAQGCKLKKKKHDGKKKWIANRLSWSVSGVLPIRYAIYRDPQLIDLVTQLPGTRTQFIDRNIDRSQQYTYYIVGINMAGTQSEPVAIPVTATCTK